MPIDMIITYCLCLALLYFAGWLLMVPLRWLLRLLGNSILGAGVLWVINLTSSFTGMYIAVNPVTALIVGLLGVPGAALLFIARLLF